MGDIGEPGGTRELIIKSALLSGASIAVCNCGAIDMASHTVDCPVRIAQDKMKEHMREELKHKK